MKTHLFRYCACLLLLLIMLPEHAHAQNSDIFTVKNVKVDITAANAMDARNEAFEKAQIDAFDKLAKRILSEDEAADFTTPEALAVSSMIRDYEVTNEKLSAVRYIGTYTFRFKPAPVRRFLTGRGSTYTEVKSKPVLILPFVKQETHQGTQKTRLWSAPNPWMEAWSSTVIEGGLVPLTVPVGDISDVRDINESNPMQLNSLGLQAILNRYGAGEVVIALATLQGARMVDVQIFRTDRGRAEFTTTLDISSHIGESQAMLLERGVRKVHGLLQKNWKTKTAVQSTRKETMTINAYFSDLRSWASMQSSLRNTPGVIDMNVGSLTPESASITLTFQGAPDHLKLALEQSNLYLKENASVSSHADGDVDIYAYMNSYGLSQYSGEKPKTQKSYDLYDRMTLNTHRTKQPQNRGSLQAPAGYHPPSSSRSSRNGGFEATF